MNRRSAQHLLLQILVSILVAGAAQAAESSSLERLNGRWKLDWDRSESFEPVMKALEVPWLLRKMAGVVTVHVTFKVAEPTCPGCEPSMQIESENPIKNTNRVVQLDGVARPFTDPIGNESMDQFWWRSDKGVEMVRSRVLKSGKKAKIHEFRTVTEDLRTLVSTMTVWVDGVERASVRRIMSKVAP